MGTRQPFYSCTATVQRPCLSQEYSDWVLDQRWSLVWLNAKGGYKAQGFTRGAAGWRCARSWVERGQGLSRQRNALPCAPLRSAPGRHWHEFRRNDPGLCDKYLGAKNGVARVCSNTQWYCNGMLSQHTSLKCDLEDCPWKVMKCVCEDSLDAQCR